MTIRLIRYSALILLCLTSRAWPGESTAYYPFTLPWDHPGIPEMIDSENIKSIDDRKYINRNGDQLVYADGTIAKFWGVGVAIAKDFPPASKQEAEKVADRFLGYGINYVRFTAFDYKRLGLFESWYQNGKLDKQVMDRLDYFISLLRKRGIYYSFVVNDSSRKTELIHDISPNNQKIAYKKYHYVQIYDERVEAVIKDWYRALYSHVNPYTGVSYAHDPANIILAVVNEDSVVNGYFRNNGEYLSKKNYEDLELLYNNYLREKYGNTASLRLAWEQESRSGLSQHEKIEDASVRLLQPKQLKHASTTRVGDVFDFLQSLDSHFSSTVLSVLHDIGYRGLYTFTNDFYGFDNIRLSMERGNFIEMHGYFDHWIKTGSAGKAKENISNMDMLAQPAKNKGMSVRAFDRNFYKFFVSAVEDMPFFISEWNHTGWSDYAFEGPLLMTAYAALQDYAGVAAHTYLSHGLEYKSPYVIRGLAVNANPVMMSLFPTLSRVWRKRYIQPSNSQVVVPLASSKEELRELDVRAYAERLIEFKGVSLQQGFLHKIRVKPVGETLSGAFNTPLERSGAWLSDTGEIDWEFGNSDSAYIKIDAPKFKAIAGRVSGKSFELGSIVASLHDTGAITIVAMDDQPLAKSRKILFTIVSSFRNSHQVRKGSKVYGNKMVEIESPGRAPVLMKRIEGTVSVVFNGRQDPMLSAILVDGTKLDVDVLEYEAGETQSVTFGLGSQDTPWYLLEFGGFAAAE